MYDRPNLGLEDAMRGLQAALNEAKRDESEGRPVVIAIVDHMGDMVAYARQDRCLEMSKLLSEKKAYTSAIGRRSSGEYGEFIKSRAGSPVELHVSSRATSSPGGIAILRSSDGVCLGGIGVSGAASASRDEEIGRAAIAAMGL